MEHGVRLSPKSLYEFGLLTFMQVVAGFAPLHRRLGHRGD